MRQRAHSSHLESVRTDLQLTQVNNELLMLRREMTQLKQRNSHLLITLQDLKLKYGEGSPGMWLICCCFFFF